MRKMVFGGVVYRGFWKGMIVIFEFGRDGFCSSRGSDRWWWMRISSRSIGVGGGGRGR